MCLWSSERAPSPGRSLSAWRSCGRAVNAQWNSVFHRTINPRFAGDLRGLSRLTYFFEAGRVRTSSSSSGGGAGRSWDSSRGRSPGGDSGVGWRCWRGAPITPAQGVVEVTRTSRAWPSSPVSGRVCPRVPVACPRSSATFRLCLSFSASRSTSVFFPCPVHQNNMNYTLKKYFPYWQT